MSGSITTPFAIASKFKRLPFEKRPLRWLRSSRGRRTAGVAVARLTFAGMLAAGSSAAEAESVMRQCGAQWYAAQASGSLAGQTWQQFLAACRARLATVDAQVYVGNDFSSGSSLLASLQSRGAADGAPPLVIVKEYSPSEPTNSGAIFNSAGTVKSVTFFGGGKYDFTVYALALVARNASQNQMTFTVIGAQTFSGDATTTGPQNLPANFSVEAGNYLAFAGVGPFYPQTQNDAPGSDTVYASASEPDLFPSNFTAIRPILGQTFTVGGHGDKTATYEIAPNTFGNQGRYYGIGVAYAQLSALGKPTVPTTTSSPGSTVEFRTDRPGNDYRIFNVSAENFSACLAACQADSGCQAWSYESSNAQRPNGVCWLKAPAPDPVAKQITTSGVMLARLGRSSPAEAPTLRPVQYSGGPSDTTNLAAGACANIPGLWSWFANGDVTFNSDGTLVQGALTGEWVCTDGHVVIHWSHNYVDNLLLSPEGTHLQGTKNVNSQVSGNKYNSGTPPTNASSTFANPMYNGYRLDWCRIFETECGAPAADAFCRVQGFSGVGAFKFQSKPGVATMTVGQNSVCDPRWHGCDSFEFVRCR
jgi:PAN domain